MTILNKDHLLRLCREDLSNVLCNNYPKGNARIEAALENITDTLNDWDYWEELQKRWKDRGEELPPPDPAFTSNRENR